MKPRLVTRKLRTENSCENNVPTQSAARAGLSLFFLRETKKSVNNWLIKYFRYIKLLNPPLPKLQAKHVFSYQPANKKCHSLSFSYYNHRILL